MGYIKVAKVYEKLKKAEEFCAPVLMTAGVGWGKSAAAEYYYRRKKPLILFCKNGKIQEKPDIQSFRGSVVIIEDMQWLSDEEDISYLRELLHTQGIQVVMIKRGEIPKYLAVEAINLDFVRIQERDLALSEKEIGQFLKEKGILCCLCKQNIKKKTILYSLMYPFFFIGILTLIIGIISNNATLIILSLFNISGCTGDLIMFYHLLKLKDYEFSEYNDPIAFGLYTDKDLSNIKMLGLDYVEKCENLKRDDLRKIVINKKSIIIFIIYYLICILNIFI